MKIAITGANGNLGQRLIGALSSEHSVRAIVRSARAKQTLLDRFGETLDVAVVDYGDADGLTEALAGIDHVVHLVGIIKESAANPFAVAHEGSCTALTSAAAAAGLKQIVHLSIVGADVSSGNACLASRGRADNILLSGSVPAAVIRVPMVLGEGDYASAALLRQARSGFTVAFRASSLEQPIYAGDVINALIKVIDGNHAGVLELAGAESLPRRELIRRAAGVLEESGPVVLSLPVGLGYLVASLLERAASPPITRAMLGVLDHDDRIDVEPACKALGMSLTSLDDTIRKIASPVAH